MVLAPKLNAVVGLSWGRECTSSTAAVSAGSSEVINWCRLRTQTRFNVRFERSRS